MKGFSEAEIRAIREGIATANRREELQRRAEALQDRSISFDLDGPEPPVAPLKGQSMGKNRVGLAAPRQAKKGKDGL